MSSYPYADRFEIHRTLPEKGLSRDEVISQLRTMATEEDQFRKAARSREPCIAATTTTTTS